FATPPDEGLDGPISRLVFSPDGKVLFGKTGSHYRANAMAAQWDVATGNRLSSIPWYGNQVISTPAGLRSLQAGLGEKRFEVVLYDPTTGKAQHTVHWARPQESGEEVDHRGAYALTADGRTLLIVHRDGVQGRKP